MSVLVRLALMLVGWLALMLVGWIVLLSPALAERRVALLIGNSNYLRVAKLINPSRDAAALETLLRTSGFDTVLHANDLGVAAMRRTLRDYSDQVHGADVALVFVAGHGLEVNGTNYLLPVDATLERDIDIEDETVSLDRVMQILEPARRLRLVILDACRDNPFVPNMKRSLAGRSVGRGLARLDAVPTDTLIAYAAKAGSTASDGTGTNSPYTAALIRHLGTPGLDVRLALGRVRDEVIASTANRQEPFVYGSLGGREITLVPAAAPEIMQKTALDHTKREAELKRREEELRRAEDEQRRLAAAIVLPAMPAPSDASVEELIQLYRKIMVDVDTVFGAALPKGSWEGPRIIFHMSPGLQSCSLRLARASPQYCSQDRTIYLDRTFLLEISSLPNNEGRAALAYLTAEQFAAHLQNLLGFRQQWARLNAIAPGDQGLDRVPIRSTCLAGFWAKRATIDPFRNRPLNYHLAGVRAAAALRDRIRKEVRLTDEEYRGTPQQRERWFARGFSARDVGECDTFAVKSP
jgi:predicted metalloprotease